MPLSFCASIALHAMALSAVVLGGWSAQTPGVAAAPRGAGGVLTILPAPRDLPAGAEGNSDAAAVAVEPAVAAFIPESLETRDAAPEPPPQAEAVELDVAGVAARETIEVAATRMLDGLPLASNVGPSGGDPAARGTDEGESLLSAGGGMASPVVEIRRAAPLYRKNPEPSYPALARRRGQEGTVLLRVTVTRLGGASEVVIERSSGFSLLDRAAIDSVRRWEFEPARHGSQAVESKIEVPVRFELEQ